MFDNENLIPMDVKPINLFKNWFDIASKSEPNDPNAMTLSTVSKDNKPSSRIVLLKSYDEDGFVFYTNSNSKKGKAISNNSFVSLNFFWKTQKRQVRIDGKAELINSKKSDEYFFSRPLESKIGSWASDQSEILLDRSILEKKIEEVKKKFANSSIPRPSYWNGYLVTPSLIEFWKQMPHRLHDRVVFKSTNKGWESKRLFP